MSFREPMFLITDDAGHPVGVVAVEDGRWIGRDTAGRTLFDRKNLAGATAAARPVGRLVSTAWYGIRGARTGETRSDRVRHDRRGLPYVTDPQLGPMYVTPCCAATVTITIDDGALCCRACYAAVDHRLAWDPDLGRSTVEHLDGGPGSDQAAGPDGRIDEVLRRQGEHIDRVGWSVTAVLPTDDDPGVAFAYTVGLTAHGLPELVIAGLPADIAYALLNDLAGRVYDKAARLRHGQRIGDLLVGYDAVIVDGPATEALYPGAAYARYGAGRVRLRQVAWPDPQGRFPWQPGYDHGGYPQPLIGQPDPSKECP